MTAVLRNHATYMSEAFAPDFRRLVKFARTELDGRNVDTLVGTGLSGALVVPHLARRLGMHWAIVRKNENSTHSYRKVEGAIGERWAFVDDLVDCGSTLKRVHEAMRRHLESHHWVAEYAGALLYHDHRGWRCPGCEPRYARQNCCVPMQSEG